MTRLLLSTAAGAVLCGLASAVSVAGEPPSLRGDVTATHDTLTLGDLVADAPAATAKTPLFRAPGLGQTGTIQAKRIVAAAEALGLGPVETGGRLAISVTRAARHVGAPEIEAAIRKRLAADFGADPGATGIVLDAPTPSLVLPPDTVGEVVAAEVTLDRRSRRVAATVWLGPSPTERRAQLRVAGIMVELVDVAVVSRSLDRGQTVRPGDITVEKRVRDLVPTDTVQDGAPLEGRVARRAIGAGSLVRSADLIRPEIVGRGDLVTVVYEAKGVSLALRAKATDPGALGDTITVVNPASKKTLQGVVIGPGRVSVSTTPPTPGRIAAAGAP